jgi:transposase
MSPEIQEMSREQLLVVVKEQYDIKERLQAELNQLKKLVFGSKSERFVPEVDPKQTSLDFGQTTEVLKEEPATETITYEREKNTGKQKPSRQPIPAHLERGVHEIQPEEDITGLVKIGEEVTEELEYVPGKLFVNKFVRPKYVKKEGEQTKVLIGQLPVRPLPKCIAGPNLLAALIVAKFIDHLPVYRQLQMFKRMGVELSESTLIDWFMRVSKLIKPLYEAHKRQILLALYLLADETPIGVLESNNPGSLHRGYHWAYYDPVKKAVIFDYRPGRGKEGPKEMLKNFTGHLQTDGYGVYDEFGKRQGITLMHCWAHARRKFVDAEESDRARAGYVLQEIQKLYALEREIRGQQLSNAEIIKLRTEKALPVIEGLKKWMLAAKPGLLPKSPMGKAIDYTLPRIAALKVYTTDSKLLIDNNPVENAIRPIALGRKNYLFAGSHEAAQNAAMFYSLFATCKAKGINPYEWLAETLRKIATHPINRIEELLPGWDPAAKADN